MAMYIDFKKPGDVKVNTICWHTGEPKPDLHKSQVLVVQADGDELDHIRRKFTGIPFVGLSNTGGPVVIWRNPWAAFIMDNL